MLGFFNDSNDIKILVNYSKMGISFCQKSINYRLHYQLYHFELMNDDSATIQYPLRPLFQFTAFSLFLVIFIEMIIISNE